MLLLFWRGVPSGLGIGGISAQAQVTGVGQISLLADQGTISAQATLTASGVQYFQGIGTISAQATLTASGVQIFQGIGSAQAQAGLVGTGLIPVLADVGTAQVQASLLGTGLFLPHLDGVGQIQAQATLSGTGQPFLRADIGYALARAGLVGVGGEVLSEVEYLWTISGSGGVQYQEGYHPTSPSGSVQYYVRSIPGSGGERYLQRQQTRRAQYHTEQDEPGTEYLIRRRGR